MDDAECTSCPDNFTHAKHRFIAVHNLYTFLDVNFLCIFYFPQYQPQGSWCQMLYHFRTVQATRLWVTVCTATKTFSFLMEFVFASRVISLTVDVEYPQFPLQSLIAFA